MSEFKHSTSLRSRPLNDKGLSDVVCFGKPPQSDTPRPPKAAAGSRSRGNERNKLRSAAPVRALISKKRPFDPSEL
ncbi:Protein of unknown function [Gryllus bimaculatus]|nr:Protein of unknown function [Gryllus bimaculatus]